MTFWSIIVGICAVGGLLAVKLSKINFNNKKSLALRAVEALEGMKDAEQKEANK